MVQKVFAFMNKEIANIHHAAYLLGVFAFGSQLLGLVRDRMLAHHFGASSVLDVYYAAFRIPDTVYIAIASLVSLSVLVPFLSESFMRDKESGGSEHTRALLSSVTTLFFGLIAIISSLLFIAMPSLAQIVAPGFVGENQELFILLSRILLLSPIILGFSNVLGSITQSKHKFFVYAVAPMLYNLGIIIGILFFMPLWGMAGVVAGVILGSLFHVLIQVPTVVREGLFPYTETRGEYSKAYHSALDTSLARARFHTACFLGSYSFSDKTFGRVGDGIVIFIQHSIGSSFHYWSELFCCRLSHIGAFCCRRGREAFCRTYGARRAAYHSLVHAGNYALYCAACTNCESGSRIGKF